MDNLQVVTEIRAKSGQSGPFLSDVIVFRHFVIGKAMTKRKKPLCVIAGDLMCPTTALPPAGMRGLFYCPQKLQRL
jgi:hypothetical protein